MRNILVFDFGGVLIDWNPRHLYRDIFESQEEMEWFLSHVCTSSWNLEQDRGRPFQEAIALKIAEFPDYSRQIELFFTGWPRMLGGEIAGTVKLLEQLHGHYRIFGLTNWSDETYPVAREKFSFLSLFEGIVVSGTEKLVKPDRAIFELLLNRYHLEPGECIYIDDNQPNIDTANSLGFHGILFRDADQLKQQLTLLGILPC